MEYIAVPVPTGLVPEVMRLIVDRLEEETGLAVLAAAPGDGDAAASPGDGWSREDLARLRASSIATAATVSAMLTALADAEGDWLTTSELVELTGIDRGRIKNAPAQLTRHLAKHYGGKPWPFEAIWGPHLGAGYPSEVHYRVSGAVAERWREVVHAAA